MRSLMFGLAAASILLTGCATYADEDYGYSAYDYDKPDPHFGGYFAENFFSTGPRYHEYRLSETDRIYRGRDGRYYCRRSDGTTGLIVGGIAGGVLGNIIDGGHSRGVGTVLGALVGAVAGSSIDRNANNQNQQIRC